jgi:hypothetical protein
VNVWIGIGTASLLLFVGVAGLAVGLFLVAQQLRLRQVNQTHRAKKLEELRALPNRPTQILEPSQRPTMNLRPAPTPPAGVGDGPALSPEDEPDVPTGVFRASQYKDIDTLLKDADQYVQKNKKR